MDGIFDAVVIGAGPAGSAFLLSVPASLSIAVIDKKTSRKVCGGLLSPDAVKALSSLGLSLPAEVRVSPEISVIRTLDLENGAKRYYPRNYINIDRTAFDAWLSSHVPEKTKTFSGTCVSVAENKGIYEIAYKSSDGAVSVIKAKAVIGADGAYSAVRKSVFPGEKRGDLYVAIQQWFLSEECSGVSGKDAFSCIFDSSESDCYAWIFAKNGRTVFGGAYSSDGTRERFEAQKRHLADRGITFGKPLETEACGVVFGRRKQKFVTGKRGTRVFLIGEAASFVRPSSLEGISSALISGRFLGEAFASGKSDIYSEYRRKTFPLRLKLRFKRLKAIVLCSPFLRALVMKSGIASVKFKKN